MKKALIRRLDALDYSGTEAMNAICSNLAFAGKNMRKIVMTSCEASEGKSFLTIQIANNLTKRGKRVVIVDADLRRSTILKKFALKTAGEWCGLAHYLTGHNTLDDVLYATNFDNLFIIPAGRDLKNPVHLLDSEDFRGLLDTLTESFDIVLVDAPPVGLVIDAAEIAKACDGTIIAIHYNKTRRRTLADVKRQIIQSGCPILGCIINMVSFDGIAAKKYYNRAYYSHYNDDYARKPDQ